MTKDCAAGVASKEWDHSGHENFYEYYAQESSNPETLQRFSNIQNKVLRILGGSREMTSPLEVVDIGCGAGTQCRMWAILGHHVKGIDINQPLIDLAKERAAKEGLNIDFSVASATELPLLDNSADVCLVPELLEHVQDWQSSIREFARILRPGGVLFLSTTNKLCPIQQEFNLPLYSWYPRFLKHRYEALALTTRPQLVNYAKYPAVHWFSFFSLRAYLKQYGFQSMDRFDSMDVTNKGLPARVILAVIRHIPLARFLAHVATPYTSIIAVKVQ